MTALNLIQSPSPNFDQRPTARKPDMLILHYTGMKTGAEAISRLQDPDAKVSAHYVVEEDGRILQLVDEDNRAWHAGVSHWAGEDSVNDFSIGVEIVNPGHEWGYRAFPNAQMQSLLVLCKDIVERNDISSTRVLGHSDVAYERKTDPGELFNWNQLADGGIGIVVDELSMGADMLLSEVSYHSTAVEITTLQEQLVELGYGLIISGQYSQHKVHLLHNSRSISGRRLRQEPVLLSSDQPGS